MQKVYTVLLLALLVLTPMGLPRPIVAVYAATAQAAKTSPEVTLTPALSSPAARVLVQMTTANATCVVGVHMGTAPVQQTVDIEALWACDAVVVKPLAVIEPTQLAVVSQPVQSDHVVVLSPVPERISVGFTPWYPETQPSALVAVSGSEGSRTVRAAFTYGEQRLVTTGLSTYVSSKTLAQLGSMLC